MTCTIYSELSSARKGSSLFSDHTHTHQKANCSKGSRAYIDWVQVLEVKKEVPE